MTRTELLCSDPTTPATGPPFWRQHTPFTCGPAALGNLLQRALGYLPRDPFQDEIQMWRESTTLLCPGSHPLGLALAAARRGLPGKVVDSGPRPWLWKHIRSEHSGAAGLRAYRAGAVEQGFRSECASVGIPIATREGPSSSDAATRGLLLVDTHRAGGAHSDPHWIGLIQTGNALEVFDPLRRSAYLSSRSFSAWWSDSGYQGNRAWIDLHPDSRGRR